MLIIFLAVIFALLAIGTFIMFWALDDRQASARTMRERLAAVQQAEARGPSEELALLRDELLSDIPALNRLLARSHRVSRLQRVLSQADLKIRAGKFLLICLAAGVGLAFVVMLLTRMNFLAFLAGAAGLFLPWTYVSFKRSQRFHKFEALFPEAIDLLARAVRAGHAFTTALELIGSEVPEPVAGEFRKLFEEQKFGLPVRDALLNLAERVPILDVKFFVTSVMLQRETGGNLAEILDKLSYVIRERFKILRQVRVYTAQGRLTMALLMGLPPLLVVIMFFVSPDFIKVLFTDPIGHVLLVIGIMLQTIGFFLIRKIIHIQV